MEVSVPQGPAAARPSPDANSDPSGADGCYGNPPSGDDAPGDAADASRIRTLRMVNGASIVLTAAIVLGVVLFEAAEGGVYADEFLWMKYQTLVTPAGWTELIWLPILLLEGLFAYASALHPILRRSPLAGYDAIPSDPSRSAAAHFSPLCVATLLSVRAHDRGRVGIAFVGAVLQAAIAANVLRTQDARALDQSLDESEAEGADDDLKSRALERAALRLPFELHAGHALATACVSFNALLAGFDRIGAPALLAAAHATLLGILCAGAAASWGTDRRLAGVGAALAWHLAGVAAELRAPSQPIYNEFSDGAISAARLVAGVAATALATMLAVRAAGTAMIDRCGATDDSVFVDNSIDDGEGEATIGVGYVRA